MPLDTRLPILAGQAFSLAEPIETLSQLRLQKLKAQAFQAEAAAAERERERQERLRRLVPQALGGDAQARRQALGMDPSLREMFKGARADQLEQANRVSGQVARLLVQVRESPIPARAYAQARQYALTELGIPPDKVPEQYPGQAWINFKIAENRQLTDMLAEPGFTIKQGVDPGGRPGYYRVPEQGPAERIEGFRPEPAPKEPRADFGDARKLRGEFQDLTKTFRGVQAAYGRVHAATETPSAAGDIALVFAFMKMLDPTSVVRESEFATAANAAGVPERIRNTWNRLLTGERLTPSQRQDFTQTAAQLYGQARNTVEGIAERYRGLAQSYGLDPEAALGGFELEPLEGAQPQTGVQLAPKDISRMSMEQIAGLSEEAVMALSPQAAMALQDRLIELEGGNDGSR